MSYATGPAPKPHDTPTTRMGYSVGTKKVNPGKVSNTPPTAWKPTKKQRHTG